MDQDTLLTIAIAHLKKAKEGGGHMGIIDDIDETMRDIEAIRRKLAKHYR